MKILQTIKHTVWPGFPNAFHPYLLRWPALALATGCLLLIQVVAHVDGRTGDTLGVARSVSGDGLLHQTNQQRRAAGVDPLREDARLTAAARDKARHMLDRGYWSHYGPDGRTPWSFIRRAGYEYRHAGENLAKEFQTSQGVMSGWLDSPEHRENLLGARYRDVGIATAEGDLNGEKTTVVVALYAAPRNAARDSGGGAAMDRGTGGGPMVLPAVRTYSAARPLNVLQTMPPATQAAAAAALLLAAVYIAQHLVVRRNYLLWDAHVHPRPLLQAALLLGILAILVHTSYGAVG